MKNWIVESSSDDVFFNLAFEEYAFRYLTGENSILFFWNSHDACVMGKFQNPYREVIPSFLKDQGVKLARRFTGGGTVYHDRGNVNFSFITSRTHYNPDLNFQSIIQALKKMGCEAVLGEKKDLFLDGLKFSGSAFSVNRQSGIHHGTLLIDADLKRLTSVLKKPDFTVLDRSIHSRPAKVCNLIDRMPGMTRMGLQQAIMDSHPLFNAGSVTTSLFSLIQNDPRFHEIYQRYQSNDWVYGFPEEFELSIDRDIKGRRITFYLKIMNNRVMEIRTDSQKHPVKMTDLSQEFHQFDLDKMAGLV